MYYYRQKKCQCYYSLQCLLFFQTKGFNIYRWYYEAKGDVIKKWRYGFGCSSPVVYETEMDMVDGN